MNKDKLIDELSEKMDTNKSQARDALEHILDLITKSLQKGEEVTLTGFGAFSVSKRAARAGINPRTKEKMQIPEIKVPKFRAGKVLKEAVR